MAVSHPEAPSRLGLAVGDEETGLLKRHRSGAGSEDSQPCSQGALEALAGCRGVETVGPQVPLLSSVIGRALLHGHAGLVCNQMRWPGEAVSHPEAPSR